MPRRRIPEDYEARRESLLDATWEFLLEQGYERATLNNVIAHVGTSKGAFYHYFESREELLAEVVERAIRDGMEQVERLGDRADPALAKLDRFLGVSADRPAAAATLRRLFLQLRAAGDVALLDRLRGRVNVSCLAPLVRIVEQGIAEGEFDTPFPAATAEAILAATDRALLEAMRLLLSELDHEQVARAWTGEMEALLLVTERVLGLDQGRLSRLRPEQVRALVEQSRRALGDARESR